MKAGWIVAGMVAGGAALVVLSRAKAGGLPQDVQIDPDMGKHRGLAYTGSEPDNTPTRMPSAQDPRGGPADYLGYNYVATTPSRYAMGEPAQNAGAMYDKAEDRWNWVPPAPLDYEKPPMRIPRVWKDANRFWDSISAHGGVESVGQRIHLFHLRPSAPTRGMRSISGALAPVGGGQSTASRARIPAIFVPSAVS